MTMAKRASRTLRLCFVLRSRATTEAGAAKSRHAAACRRRAWRLATTSSCGAIPPTATLRVSSRHRTRKPASRDTERRGNSVPSLSRLSVLFRVGRRANFALRGTRNYAEVRFPRALAFPCSSVSAARPLPRPGGTQAEGASRRDGADRGVSLKVMRRSAAMNRASDCRPARLQWSRASAMPQWQSGFHERPALRNNDVFSAQSHLPDSA